MTVVMGTSISISNASNAASIICFCPSTCLWNSDRRTDANISLISFFSSVAAAAGGAPTAAMAPGCVATNGALVGAVAAAAAAEEDDDDEDVTEVGACACGGVVEREGEEDDAMAEDGIGVAMAIGSGDVRDKGGPVAAGQGVNAAYQCTNMITKYSLVDDAMLGYLDEGL